MATIKTAISIQQSLFDQMEALARDLQVPRNRVFVLAVEEYLRRQENRRLLADINAAYQDAPDAGERKRLRQMRASHRRIVKSEW